MKHFSFKILILCMIFPPVCYMGTVSIVEYTLEHHHRSAIEAMYLGDPGLLLEGQAGLKKTVNQNIEKYLINTFNVNSSIMIDISVFTSAGTKIYPVFFDDVDTTAMDSDLFETASHNYRLMHEGLELLVSVALGQNSPLSMLIFFCFLFCAIAFLYLRYAAALKRSAMDEEKKKNEMYQLRQLERANQDRLDDLFVERKKLQIAVEALRAKVNESSKNEEGMLEEVLRLENELEQNQSGQQIQTEEIYQLNEQIERLKHGKKKGGSSKNKTQAKIFRRFRALYKNVIVYERAVDGYNDLEEGLTLKCEEIIHKLNEDPEAVTVKRKVFGRKGRETVLEVIFGYKGRLYFRNNKDGKVEILAVGTKNSQEKELHFLDKL